MIAVLLAAVEEEGAPTLFYTAGIVLAVFAVAISAAGLRRSRFPEGGARAVMVVSVVLVVFTMAASVISSA
ncbi:MAG: hypothetical protein MSC31_00285 [Solirubrobacteraceae bacterium MAG38_C4-C5]|nr:hypothetical protein [Candidatus Siliceabacter maunaloa]